MTPRPAVDIFLLAGQFPGQSAREALDNCVRYALAAERAGFGGVWLAEHHFIRYGRCASAPTLAGYLLGRTSTLAVGTAAAILSNRHPVALAEETLLLDAVSGGRFRLGVARGGPWVDLEVFGTGLPRYERGFPAALDVLLAALGGSVTAAGEFFDFRPVDLGLSARGSEQAGPVWVAATSPGTVALAAARGLPLLLGVHDDDVSKAALLERYRAAGGPADAPHASAHLVGDPDALRKSMPGWLATTADYVRLVPGAGRDPAAYLEHLLAISPVGTVAEFVARLRASAAATGVRRQLLLVEGVGEPSAVLATIESLGSALSTVY
ncbi:LLM class flavin-dependent oxidoreductase [Longispora sp. K20-0274]|uniref:LLM class flavin-dependent oxidoreductase n=1 Tax=Longispora sp. K20-0274 TaxID=3088255 RepID=UPI00399C038C